MYLKVINKYIFKLKDPIFLYFFNMCYYFIILRHIKVIAHYKKFILLKIYRNLNEYQKTLANTTNLRIYS